MANEVTLMWELEPAIPMTCADGTGIEKGTVLAVTDPFTVIKVTGAAPNVAGFAKEEKIADDGNTTIAVYLRAVIKGVAGGSITVGDSLIMENATNEFLTGTTAAEGSQGCGVALETAGDGETFLILFNAGTAGTPNA